MTVNERLSELKLFDPFDLAIRERNNRRAKDLLIATGLRGKQATETVLAILSKPKFYSFDFSTNENDA